MFHKVITYRDNNLVWSKNQLATLESTDIVSPNCQAHLNFQWSNPASRSQTASSATSIQMSMELAIEEKIEPAAATENGPKFMHLDSAWWFTSKEKKITTRHWHGNSLELKLWLFVTVTNCSMFGQFVWSTRDAPHAGVPIISFCVQMSKTQKYLTRRVHALRLHIKHSHDFNWLFY